MNLNTATPQELELYKNTVSGVLGIDPLMLDFIDMPNPFGTGTNKVLYAKRGAAEVLRKNMGIDILSLTPYESDGWLSYTVVAKNKEGRQEIAVGAAYTKNIYGEKVAHAVMTAQTRAVRRVTLQFVTGGILDESEVQTQTQFTGAPAASQAELTGSPIVVPPPIPTLAIPPFSQHVPAPATFVAENAAPDVPLTAPTMAVPTTSEPPQAAMQAAEVPAEPKKKRTRKPKGQVDIASPGQSPTFEEAAAAAARVADGPAQPAPQTQAEFEAAQEKMRADAMAQLAAKTSAPAAAPVATPAAPEAETAKPVPPQVQASPLSPEQQADYKARTRKYTNEVLVEGGMLPSEGIGGITMKLRKFSQVQTGAASHNLTPEQYEDLFSFLDGFTKQFGAQALVAYIDKAIGATK